MALFTDGAPADIAYLRTYDSTIDQVASDEGIDLDIKLAVAAEEIGEEILAFLLLQGPSDTSGANWGGVSGTVIGQSRRRQIGLSDVVVTTPVRRWHALATLSAVYRDAYNSQLNDRYAGRWNTYTELAKEAGERAFEIGIGLVSRPTPKPNPPVVIPTTDTVARADYWVQATWINDAGDEGAPSDPVSVSLGAGDSLRIANPPSGITGWNIYIGTDRDSVQAQNPAPIDVATAWVIGDSLASGAAPGNGQAPDYFVAERQFLLRG
jgi:hypothetical protein